MPIRRYPKLSEIVSDYQRPVRSCLDTVSCPDYPLKACLKWPKVVWITPCRLSFWIFLAAHSNPLWSQNILDFGPKFVWFNTPTPVTFGLDLSCELTSQCDGFSLHAGNLRGERLKSKWECFSEIKENCSSFPVLSWRNICGYWPSMCSVLDATYKRGNISFRKDEGRVAGLIHRGRVARSALVQGPAFHRIRAEFSRGKKQNNRKLRCKVFKHTSARSFRSISKKKNCIQSIFTPKFKVFATVENALKEERPLSLRKEVWRLPTATRAGTFCTGKNGVVSRACSSVVCACFWCTWERGKCTDLSFGCLSQILQHFAVTNKQRCLRAAACRKTKPQLVATFGGKTPKKAEGTQSWGSNSRGTQCQFWKTNKDGNIWNCEYDVKNRGTQDRTHMTSRTRAGMNVRTGKSTKAPAKPMQAVTGFLPQRAFSHEFLVLAWFWLKLDFDGAFFPDFARKQRQISGSEKGNGFLGTRARTTNELSAFPHSKLSFFTICWGKRCQDDSALIVFTWLHPEVSFCVFCVCFVSKQRPSLWLSFFAYRGTANHDDPTDSRNCLKSFDMVICSYCSLRSRVTQQTFLQRAQTSGERQILKCLFARLQERIPGTLWT